MDQRLEREVRALAHRLGRTQVAMTLIGLGVVALGVGMLVILGGGG